MEKPSATRTPQDRAWDLASIQVIGKAEQEGADTRFFVHGHPAEPVRVRQGRPVLPDLLMGPCRITAKAPLGICGADADTIVARNYLREVAAGTASHSDHGRHLVCCWRRWPRGMPAASMIKDEALCASGRAQVRRGGTRAALTQPSDSALAGVSSGRSSPVRNTRCAPCELAPAQAAGHLEAAWNRARRHRPHDRGMPAPLRRWAWTTTFATS